MRTFALLLLVACGTTPPPTPVVASGSNLSCENLQVNARGRLSRILDENQTCTQDADCVVVALGASCFDSCSRVIAATGKNAFDTAVADVDSSECKTYTDQGCPAPIVPPCAPPNPPLCNAGKCQ